jgi:hypothetical protein
MGVRAASEGWGRGAFIQTSLPNRWLTQVDIVHPGSLCLGGKRIAWQALGRPKGELAMQKRRNPFGRGSVSTEWRIVVWGVQEAPWDWESGEAEKTSQSLAKTMRKPCENLAKP